ncbi:MICOS complex subunit MIC27 isoform X2 [Hemicordylus capensis]|uniref:MICOS complex subunit MIC27 isoform X2 n=1 Tax=Hemicordylus capensis TaxID=884348 RepID=UPI002303257F|nr:MICOS complex subunit MIC27 isoform X2 [Hemicordylus capensis]
MIFFDFLCLNTHSPQMVKWAALPTALGSATISVYAATEDNPKSHRVKAHQLPIYNAPPLESRYIDEKPGRLQSGISSVRETTSYYINGCKDAYLFVKNGMISTIQFGKDAYVYLKNPPPEFLPKVGVITISGLTGLVLARKGSRFKKIAYPLGLCTLGVSLCYPVQSVVIAKVTGKKVYAASRTTYEAIASLWTKRPTAEVPLVQDKITKNVSKTDHNISEAHIVAAELEEEVKALEMHFHSGKTLAQADSTPLIAEVKVPSVVTDMLKTPKFNPDPDLMDHGQSNPEDVDMYSTRS